MSDSVPAADHPGDERHPSEAEHAGSRMYTDGYREGISHQDPTVLQQGFDAGFEVGKVAGEVAGQLEGALQAILASMSVVQADGRSQSRVGLLACVADLEALKERLAGAGGLNRALEDLETDIASTNGDVEESKRRVQDAAKDMVDILTDASKRDASPNGQG